MMSWLRRFLIRHLVSPYGLVLLPSAMFLFGWLFPPELYTYYVHEPDYMYLNVSALVFFALCVAAFLLGVRIIGAWGPRAQEGSVQRLQVRTGSPLLYLGVPLVISAFFCFVSLVLTMRSMNIVSLILSQQGTAVKLAYVGQQSDEGRWGATLFLLVGALWWAGYRAQQVDLKGLARKTFYVLYFACVVIELLTCIASFDRTNLMPAVSGLALLFLYFKTRNTQVKLAPLLLSVFGSMAAVLILFLGLQLARGAAQFDSVVTSMMGYSIVSYNRMAAMLMGILHYPYEGRGGYLIAYLCEYERLSGLRNAMGLPDAHGLWASEFPPLVTAALNTSYNWAGIFGYLFVDLGWWTPVYTFVSGLLAGSLWTGFRNGKTLGIVFYPWIAFWILFWCGWNLLLDARGIVVIQAGILLFIYDKICLRKAREIAATRRTIPTSSWTPAGAVVGSNRGGRF